MNNLVTQDLINENFEINKQTGAISISNVKCAELLGINESSVRRYIGKLLPINADSISNFNHTLTLENDTYRRHLITEEIFFSMVEYYSFESKAKNESALTLYRQIAKAGTRAFLYNEAGYTLQVVEAPKAPQTYLEVLKELVTALEENEKLQLEIKSQAPKVATYDIIYNCESTFSIRDVSRFYEIRPIDLTNLLIENDWVFRYKKGGKITIKDKAVKQKLAVQKLYLATNRYGEDVVTKRVHLTTKGILKIAKLLNIVQDDEFLENIKNSFNIE